MKHQALTMSALGRRVALVLVILCSTLGLWAAGEYSIDWHKISGGGGTSTGGVYSVSGTIGQHDAGGPLTNGQYSITGGFWALQVVQTPGAPLLKITYTDTNTAVVSWPSPSSGWNLQQTADLQTPGWGNPPENVTDNGTTKFIIIKSPAGSRFFRLKQP